MRPKDVRRRGKGPRDVRMVKRVAAGEIDYMTWKQALAVIARMVVRAHEAGVKRV